MAWQDDLARDGAIRVQSKLFEGEWVVILRDASQHLPDESWHAHPVFTLAEIQYIMKAKLTEERLKDIFFTKKILPGAKIVSC